MNPSNLRHWLCLICLSLAIPSAAAPIVIDQSAGQLTATWHADDHTYRAKFSLEPTKPLISSLSVDETEIAHDLAISYHITTGPRLQKPNQPYIFFDYPIAAKSGQVHAYDSSPSRAAPPTVTNDSDRTRVTISFNGMEAGPFNGAFSIHIYDNSPFLHLDAALTPSSIPATLAYAYDPIVSGTFTSVAYISPEDQFHRDSLASPARTLRVRHRTVVGETATGSVALFPPPHAYLFPRDFSTNFGFAQAGPDFIGLHEDLSSGNHFVPWIDAPPGRTQHMSAFLLFTNQRAEPTLDRIKQYTHGDTFPHLDGRITFISHLHPELTTAELEGHPSAPALKEALKSMGINAFHLAEFHLKGHPFDTGYTRLSELKAMFDLCQKYSDKDFLLIPGEEANTYIPGHWVYLFPKPTYLTLKPTPGRPPVEQVEPFGTVYHPQNEAELMALLAGQGALAWTTHPRIKGSEHCPDLYKDKPWYQSPTWLGATWKAMPADLSESRLGTRSLALLDEMNTWPSTGLKYMPSEIDTFDLDPTHEFYAYASVNYLHVASVPPYSDYTPVLRCLRAGDFFTTTGEILLHSVSLHSARYAITVDASWTFPLSYAVLTTFDGTSVRHTSIPLAEKAEHGRGKITIPFPAEPVRWYRVEFWDVALNGAYTQPVALK